MRISRSGIVAMLTAGAVALAACGSDTSDGASGPEPSDGDRPTVVVTTNILGDVVSNLVGDEMDVVTIMPVGADPHDFQASAQQVDQIRRADVLVVNGAGFEEGLLDVIESAEADGTPTFAAISAVAPLEIGHDDHDEEHADEEHADDHDDEHSHEGEDPHFFTDPSRMALASVGIVDFLLANSDGIDADALRANADAYIAELEALDADVEGRLAAVPDAERVLVTNHQVFGYFADRYGFEVVGTVIPGGSTVDGGSASALADLALVIEREGVPAIFVETSSSDELAQTLAAEVGDIEVVDLFSESLGDADSDGATYLEMWLSNADRIAAALAP